MRCGQRIPRRKRQAKKALNMNAKNEERGIRIQVLLVMRLIVNITRMTPSREFQEVFRTNQCIQNSVEVMRGE